MFPYNAVFHYTTSIMVFPPDTTHSHWGLMTSLRTYISISVMFIVFFWFRSTIIARISHRTSSYKLDKKKLCHGFGRTITISINKCLVGSWLQNKLMYVFNLDQQFVIFFPAPISYLPYSTYYTLRRLGRARTRIIRFKSVG